MSNLRPQIRSAIQDFVSSQKDAHIPIDVLRVIQEEANLMKETQELCDTLDADPMEQFSNIRRQVERLKQNLQVTSCSRVRSGFDYCSIDAVVAIKTINSNNNKSNNKKKKANGGDSDDGKLQLTFRYERKPSEEEGPGCQIWYSIELAHNYGEKQMMLLVQVFAPAGVPSAGKAISMQNPMEKDEEEDDSEEGGWEDIDEDETDANEHSATTTTITKGNKQAVSCNDSETSETSQSCKKRKTSNSPGKQETIKAPSESKNTASKDTDEEDGDDDTRDRYLASLDPDILHDFLESAGLVPMGEDTAFFLLMTFPFYEYEWDLVGFVLEEVFGAGSDDDSESGQD